MRAIGVKLAVITLSRGFSIEMGSSLIVIIGSFLGIPLDDPLPGGRHHRRRALEGHRGCNKWVLFKTAIGWVTCFIVGLMSAGIPALARTRRATA